MKSVVNLRDNDGFSRLKLYGEKLRETEQRLDNEKAVYPFNHYVTKGWYMEKGRKEFRLENLCSRNQLPVEIVCGFLDDDCYQGTVDVV